MKIKTSVQSYTTHISTSMENILKGQPYNMLRGSAYEQGRVQQQELNSNDCAMKITNIKDIENGKWECTVTSKDSEDNYKTGMGEIEVIVAEAPKQVYLKNYVDKDTKTLNSNDIMTLVFTKGVRKNISCIANQTRVAPNFKWFVEDTLLDGFPVEIIEKNEKDDKITYISSLSYLPSIDHLGKILRCEVNHMAYGKQQIENKSNIVQAKLGIQFQLRIG